MKTVEFNGRIFKIKKLTLKQQNRISGICFRIMSALYQEYIKGDEGQLNTFGAIAEWAMITDDERDKLFDMIVPLCYYHDESIDKDIAIASGEAAKYSFIQDEGLVPFLILEVLKENLGSFTAGAVMYANRSMATPAIDS